MLVRHDDDDIDDDDEARHGAQGMKFMPVMMRMLTSMMVTVIMRVMPSMMVVMVV